MNNYFIFLIGFSIGWLILSTRELKKDIHRLEERIIEIKDIINNS